MSTVESPVRDRGDSRRLETFISLWSCRGQTRALWSWKTPGFLGWACFRPQKSRQVTTTKPEVQVIMVWFTVALFPARHKSCKRVNTKHRSHVASQNDEPLCWPQGYTPPLVRLVISERLGATCRPWGTLQCLSVNKPGSYISPSTIPSKWNSL